MAIDGDSGTRAINVLDLMTNDLELPFNIRKFMWRGKNLGSTFTEEQKNAISNGTFDDLYLGDYWTQTVKIGDIFTGTTTLNLKYYIMDFDYFSIKKDTPHHVAVVCQWDDASKIYNSRTNVLSGYINSNFRSSDTYQTISETLEGFFDSCVSSYTDRLSTNLNSSDEKISSFIEVSTKFELISELMMFGRYVNGQIPTGSLIDSQPHVNQMIGFLVNSKAYKIFSNGWLREIGNNIEYLASIESSYKIPTLYKYNGNRKPNICFPVGTGEPIT